MQYNPDLPSIANLAINESNTTLTQNAQTHKVVINALDNQGNFVTKGTINVKFPSAISNGTDVGKFTNISVDVVNGQATFEYTGPEDLVATSAITSAETFVFTDAANSANTADWKVNFIPDTPTLRVESPTVILTQDGQAATVTVLAFDSNNQAFKTGTIIVEYPTDITNGSVSGGVFTQNEAKIENGKAIFNFTGPTPLEAIANQTFTFKYKENPTVSTTLGVQYSPETAEAISVYLLTSEYNATLNSEVIPISMNVFNGLMQPVEDGNIKVSYPSDVQDGRDVGYFEQTTVAVKDGRADFTYVAPKNLEENTTSMQFKFYYETDFPHYGTFTLNIQPAQNQIVLTTYKLVSNLSNDITMGLNSKKALSFSIQDEDGNTIEDSNVTSIKISLLNPALGDLVSTDGTTGKEYNTSTNNVSLRLDTKTTSGIIPIKVFADFKDANNVDQNITEIFNVVVLSGAPTAVSLTYNGTTYEENGLYRERYTMLVTDKYQNRVNTNPGVSLSMITGYAKDKQDGRRLFSYPDINSTLQGTSPGSMDPINDIFEVSTRNGYTPDFSNIDNDNDVLFTFGQGYTYNASGKWDVTNDGVATNQLQLLDDFDASATVDNLGYGVGHNYRQDTCNPGDEFVGQIYMDSNTSKLDNNGMANIFIDYPYYLGGKTVLISVNTVGYTASSNETSKFGETKKITLRTTGFEDRTKSVPAGTTGATYLIPIALKDAPEWYRNGNFGAEIITSDNVTYGSFRFYGQVGTCDNPGSGPGTAYVELQDVNETQGKAGSITVTNIVTADEF